MNYNKKFEIIQKELYKDHVDWEKGKDYDLGAKVAKAFNDAGFKDASHEATPFVIISDLYAASEYNTSLESIIDKAYEQGDKDIVSCISSGKNNCIKKQVELNGDTTLKTLSVSSLELNPIFDEDILEYTAIAKKDNNIVSVYADCNGTNCSVSGSGIIKLTNGENNIDIKVTAENGDTRIYKLTIYKETDYLVYIAIPLVIIAILLGVITYVLIKKKK